MWIMVEWFYYMNNYCRRDTGVTAWMCWYENALPFQSFMTEWPWDYKNKKQWRYKEFEKHGSKFQKIDKKGRKDDKEGGQLRYTLRKTKPMFKSQLKHEANCKAIKRYQIGEASELWKQTAAETDTCVPLTAHYAKESLFFKRRPQGRRKDGGTAKGKQTFRSQFFISLSIKAIKGAM